MRIGLIGGLLAVGAAGCAGAAPTPQIVYVTPTPDLATQSPARSLAPTSTLAATEPPADTPAPTSGAPATPSPDPLATPVPTLVPGMDPNVVYFGSEYEDENLTIPEPRDTFRRSERIAWAFYLTEPIGVRTLSLVISKMEDSGNSTIEWTQDAEVNPEWKHFANRARLARLLRGTGTFVMRYYVGDVKIAEGTFNLTR